MNFCFQGTVQQIHGQCHLKQEQRVGERAPKPEEGTTDTITKTKKKKKKALSELQRA